MGDDMDTIIRLIKYIVLGIVQGFTEPLPISSSGHVIIFKELLGIDALDINFEIVVNAGSLIAIIILFREKIMTLVVNSYKYVFKKNEECKSDFMYVVMLVVAVIPAGLVGFFMKDFIEEHLLTLWTVGLSLLVTAIALNFVGKMAVENSTEEITFKDAIVIGLFQVVALIPGISRSGSTMFGGLIRKIKFEDVMEFSFLLYIPISLATIVSGAIDFSTSNTPFVMGYIAAFIVSIFSTYVAVIWFFGMVRKGNLKYFSYYCIAVGTAVLIANYVINL